MLSSVCQALFQTFLKFVSGDSVFEVRRAALSKQLAYYTNTPFNCQHLFSDFFDFFRGSFFSGLSYLFIYRKAAALPGGCRFLPSCRIRPHPPPAGAAHLFPIIIYPAAASVRLLHKGNCVSLVTFSKSDLDIWAGIA